MPRQNRRRVEVVDVTRLPGSTVGERRDEWRGEAYVVQSVAGSSSRRVYRCPGCDQQVRSGQPHVVAWPADDTDAGDRRHWHTACWANRDRRSPGVQPSRSAPRY